MFIKKTLIAAVVVFLAYGFTKPENNPSNSLVLTESSDSLKTDSLSTKTSLTNSISDSSVMTVAPDSLSDSILMNSGVIEELEPKIDSSNLIFGTASYYHDMFVGRKTANGQIFRQEKMTCAHRTIKLGKYVNVTNLRNNKTVKLLVNDRMGKSRHEIDLTTAAAKILGFKVQGWTPVRIEILD